MLKRSGTLALAGLAGREARMGQAGGVEDGRRKLAHTEVATSGRDARPVSRRALRSRSIRVARATHDERERAGQRARDLEAHVARPRTRDQCENGPRPCPFVACKHHLYLDVSPSTGTIKLNFPDLEVWELAETCALDVAERGAQPLERASLLMNVTRERVRQIESVALAKLGALRDMHRLL